MYKLLPLFFLSCNLTFSQTDTLSMFFDDLPSDFDTTIYLINDFPNAKDYERVKLIKDESVYLFQAIENRNYVGAQFAKSDLETSLGFYSNSIDTFSLSDEKCIVFVNPLPQIYWGAPCEILLPSHKEEVIQNQSGPYEITGAVPRYIFDGFIYTQGKYYNTRCLNIGIDRCLCTRVKSEDQLTIQYSFDFASKSLTTYTIDLISGNIEVEQYSWE